MDFPRPSQMDAWAIDMAMGGLVILAGYTLRRGLNNLDMTLKRMEKDLSRFADLFQKKFDDHEHRLTVIETACRLQHEEQK